MDGIESMEESSNQSHRWKCHVMIGHHWQRSKAQGTEGKSHSVIGQWSLVTVSKDRGIKVKALKLAFSLVHCGVVSGECQSGTSSELGSITQLI